MNVAARIAVVLGTRPEIVKLAGIVRLLGDRALVIATGVAEGKLPRELP